MIIGVVGGIFGLVLGFSLSVLIDGVPFETKALPAITTYPVNFKAGYYVIGIVFALLSTFIAR
jgi:lipoprotein-releasing system permease protein